MKRRDFISLVGGVALGWPLAVRAQQPAMPAIGYLHFASPGPFASQVVAFRQGLREADYVEGKNVAIEYRWGEGNYDRLPALASDLVGRRVNLIVAVGPPCAHAAKNATSTIPIVFAVGTDPVGDGLVASLARPGGNLTGVSILAADLTPKRLELLSELVPQAKMIALLVNPNNANPWIGDVEKAARAKAVQLQVVKASTETEINAAFVALSQLHADGLVISIVNFMFKHVHAVAAN
jgi:putative tryptophan/tyrosine transport system substrate-binding protein